MAKRGAGCWESRLSGSERDWGATWTMGEILWHRWETRRQTEKTNLTLTSGEFPVYSKKREAGIEVEKVGRPGRGDGR